MNIILITLGILLACNLFGFVLSYLILYTERFAHLRIQQRPYKKDIFFKRLPLICFNLGLMFVLTIAGLYQFGWIFSTGSATWWIVTLEVLFLFLVDDLVFYTWHRYMHTNKVLYKKIHIIHHRAYMPFPLEYIYAHPIEWMVGLLGPFTGIFLLWAFQGGLHIYAFWLFTIIRNLHEIDIHSGIKSPISSYIPLLGEAEHHDLHHAKPTRGNYASTFKIWDKIFGTEIERRPQVNTHSNTPSSSESTTETKASLTTPMDDLTPAKALDPLS